MAKSIQERVKLTPSSAIRGLTTIKLDSQMKYVEEMPWQDAMTDILNRKVNVLSTYMVEMPDGSTMEARAGAGTDLNGIQHTFPVPFIVSLHEFVYDPYAAYLKSNSPIATKRAIMTRDHYLCGYCGKRADTIDHIVPQSKKGPNTWTNLIAACKKCNNKKADRTPEEAGMPLLWQPTKHNEDGLVRQEEIWNFLQEQAGVM